MKNQETRYNNIALNHKALLKGECQMAGKAKKKYEYLTKVLQMPDGTRKYIRAKTQEELDNKVLVAQILMKARCCSTYAVSSPQQWKTALFPSPQSAVC